MRAIITIVVWMGLSLTEIGSATAQTTDSCPATMSLEQCVSHLLTTGSAPVRSAVADSVSRSAVNREHAKATGADLGDATAQSGIRDFLPRVAAALITPGSSAGQVGDLGFKSNLRLPDGLPFGMGFTGQGGVVLHKPELSGLLTDSVRPSRLASVQRREQARLNALSDVSFTFSANAETARLGRDPRSHMSEIHAVASHLLTGVPDDAEPSARDTYSAFLRALAIRISAGDREILEPGAAARPDCRLDGNRQIAQMTMSCFTIGIQQNLVWLINAQADARSTWLKAAAETLAQAGFFRIAELLNNQPQINSSLEFRPRARAAGPTEWTGSGRFELGFANYNRMRASCGGPVNAACLQSYLQRPGVRSSLARGDRVWLQGDWKRRQAWNVSFPEDSVRISLGTASTYAVSGGYGAYFGRAEDGDRRDRFDVKANWDIARGDQLRQNRFVATAFLTHKLSDQSTLLLGGTYASRAEFVGDVTSHLGANFGLTYKISPPQKK